MDVVIVFLMTCSNFLNLPFAHQEQLAILQLRQLLSLSREIEVYDDYLTMIYGQEEIKLIQHQDRLVRKEGYMIYMEGVEDVSFEQLDNKIYLNFRKDDQAKKIQLY